MARPKNILETKTITLTLNNILIADLTQAVKTGLFGNSNAEATKSEILFHQLASSCVILSLGGSGRFSTRACVLAEQERKLSYRYFSAAFGVKCKPSAKIILLALADHTNEKGVCWPSIRHLAQKCSAGKSVVARHIAYLEAKGLIEINKSGNYNIYTLKLSPIVEKPVPPMEGTRCPPQEGTKASVIPNLISKDCTPPSSSNWKEDLEALKESLGMRSKPL